jgi:hypothetical protein
MSMRWPKQPDSRKLIDKLNLKRCVLCEKRNGVGSAFMPAASKDEPGEVVQVATKWWTCSKCERGA